MSRRNKPLAVHGFATTRENAWRDARTGVVLAPGASRNWPSRADESFIAWENTRARAAANEEKKNAFKRLSDVASLE